MSDRVALLVPGESAAEGAPGAATDYVGLGGGLKSASSVDGVPADKEEDLDDLDADDDADGHGGGGGASSLLAPETPRMEHVRLVATIVKAFIGSGVLFLPRAYSNGGWLFSALVMLAMALITQVTILRLVECRQLVPGSYSFIGLRACGRWAQLGVDAALVASQAGFCTVYVAFIARNVLQLLNVGRCWLDGSWLWLLVLLQLPIFVPLAWIRRMRTLGWTSAAANALIVAGLVGIVAWAARSWALAEAAPGAAPFAVPAFNAQSFALFLGSAVYAYEGIGMVVPVYDSLSAAGQRAFPATLSATLAGVAAVYLLVGMVPYLYLVGAAHAPVADAITLSLPDVWWAYAIMAAYCVALIFSYPLMLFPVLRIAERAAAAPLGLRAGSARARTWKRNGVRAAVVGATLLVAYAGASQLDNLVALVGCFACTPLAFIFPALFHMRLVTPRTAWANASNAAIIALGVGVFFFSTYEAIAGWAVVVIDPCPHAAAR